MCSRFEVNVRPRDLTQRFGFDDDTLAFTKGEVRPTNPVLTFDKNGAAARIWGLKVEWGSKPLINARSETLSKKVTFNRLLENRCIVPATAYFEWRRVGNARLKNRIATVSDEVFCFAGLHDGAHLVIVTCQPAADIAHIHNRMPVILAQDAATAWSDTDVPFDSVRELLQPTEVGFLNAVEDQPNQPDLFG